jgi:hypothetical protein
VSCTVTGEDGTPLAQCSFDVIVADTTSPQLTCSDLDVGCEGGGGAVVDYPLPHVEDLCDDDVALVFEPPSGHFFPVGSTPVVCRATDASGNVAECVFTVRVVDDAPPQLICPPNVVVECQSPEGTRVDFAPSELAAKCDTGAVVACDPPSGTLFPLGTTEVTCTATDSSGNRSQCSFEVSVVEPKAPGGACGNEAVLRIARVEASACAAFVNLSLDNQCPTEAVSLGIAHDGEVVRPRRFDPAPVWGGSDPEFVAVALDAEGDGASCQGSRGVTIALVGSTADPGAAAIPSGAGIVLGTLVYEPVSGVEAGSSSPLLFSDCLLPASGSPPTLCRVVCGGLPVRLSKVEGAVTIASTECFFVRGDCNGQGTQASGLDISDPVFVLNFLFTGGGDPGCVDACDVNDDGVVDLSDAIAALQYLFLGGRPPEAPFPSCGVDPSHDDLPIDCAPSERCPREA